MRPSKVCNSTVPTRNTDIDEILEHCDSLIRSLARKNFPYTITSAAAIDLDIDELAQITRFKFWLALQKQDIRNTNAYIRRIVHNEAINMVRQHKPVESLNTNDEGEPYLAHTMMASNHVIQEPAEKVEEEEMLSSYSSKLVQNILELPPQQQRAMICALKDQIVDILPLVDTFLLYGIDIESIHWPESKKELQRMRASLSVARRKLRASKISEELMTSY